VGIDFEWDPAKAESNEQIHEVSFDDAKMVFNDRFTQTRPDPLHSESEDRFVTMGMTANGDVLVVVHTDREERIRIISARKATPAERRRYEEESKR
jgi:hypothetical protein